MRSSRRIGWRTLAAAVLALAPGADGSPGRSAWAQQGNWAGVLPREFGAARPGWQQTGVIGTIIDVPPGRPLPAVQPAQPFPVQVRVIRVSADPSGPEGGVLIQADRRLVQALRHAQDLIEKQNYLDACRQLQAILEAAQDGFFHPDPADDKLHRSLKSETLRIIGGLPAEGREAYRNSFAPAADALLAQAVRADDMNALADVARLYFHTSAGHEATYRLGLHALDRNEPLAAALYLDRLRQVPEAAARWEPLLSLRAALCWYRTGTPAAAREILVELAAKHDPATLRLGGEPLPAFDGEGGGDAWLAKAFGPGGHLTPAGGNDWIVFGSDASRAAVVPPAPPPDGFAPWEAESVIPIAEVFEPTDERLHDALQETVRTQRYSFENRQRPVLPRLSPLLIGGRVMARTIGNVIALDLQTGDRLQEMFEDDGYAGLIEQWEHGGLANSTGILAQLVRQRIWADATYSSLSSDGRLVYAIEESGIAGLPPVPSIHSGFTASQSNVLRAYDVESGHIVWERGGQHDEFALPLAGSFFLGAPLPLAGRLFVLAEQNSEVRLMVLHPADGTLEWEQPLASTHVNILADPRRRAAGVSPSYADGVLVCPTGTGSVVALELMSRSLLWAYRTREEEAGADGGVVRGRRGMQVMPRAAAVPQAGGWQDEIAIVVRGHVLLTPRDADELHCLDLLDGSLRWKRPRDEALAIAGVADDQVLVVSPDEVAALKLDNGEPAWARPVELAGTEATTVTGRGFVQSGRLWVPLSTAEIVAIDITTGDIVQRTDTPDGHVPGNLVSARGLVVSQNPEGVAVFPLPEAEATSE
jgi:outer membrane protein assembly factor BamB